MTAALPTPGTKPMAAVLYEIWTDDLGGRLYAHNPDDPESRQRPIAVEVEQLRKRFRPGELAAEYWRSELDVAEANEYSAVEGWFNDTGGEYLSDYAAIAWRNVARRFAGTPAEIHEPVTTPKEQQ